MLRRVIDPRMACATHVEGLPSAHYRVLMQLEDADERAFHEGLALTTAIRDKHCQSAQDANAYIEAGQNVGKVLLTP